jgi:uncharacterized membrane protein YqjE
MPPTEPPAPGLFESLRRLCDRGLALLHNRVELFGVELEEQKARLVRLLVLGGLAVLLSCLALGVITATIVVLVGENARGPVLIGFCVLYVLAAAAAFMALRKESRSAPPAFRDTISELKKDRDWLNPGN